MELVKRPVESLFESVAALLTGREQSSMLVQALIARL